MHLLVVSENYDLENDIREYGKIHDAHIHTAESLERLLQLGNKLPDVALVILGFSHFPTLELLSLQEVRNSTSAPIMFVGGDVRSEHTVQMLDLGIDEHMPGDYSKDELFARIRAMLRRIPSPLFEGSTIVADSVHIDTVQKRVEVDGREVQLSPVEYRILEHLARHYKYLVDKRVLEQSAIHATGVPHLINTHISNLRKKLGDHVHIQTIPRRGFVLESQ